MHERELKIKGSPIEKSFYWISRNPINDFYTVFRRKKKIFINKFHFFLGVKNFTQKIRGLETIRCNKRFIFSSELSAAAVVCAGSLISVTVLFVTLIKSFTWKVVKRVRSGRASVLHEHTIKLNCITFFLGWKMWNYCTIPKNLEDACRILNFTARLFPSQQFPSFLCRKNCQKNFQLKNLGPCELHVVWHERIIEVQNSQHFWTIKSPVREETRERKNWKIDNLLNYTSLTL